VLLLNHQVGVLLTLVFEGRSEAGAGCGWGFARFRFGGPTAEGFGSQQLFNSLSPGYHGGVVIEEKVTKQAALASSRSKVESSQKDLLSLEG
jgi:hypothetical protein